MALPKELVAINKPRRFGEWMEYRREELGMTQDELANKMGNISSFVSELELADDAYLTVNEAKQLILALDVPEHKLRDVPGIHIGDAYDALVDYTGLTLHELMVEQERLTEELLEGNVPCDPDERMMLFQQRRADTNNLVAVKLSRVEEAIRRLKTTTHSR